MKEDLNLTNEATGQKVYLKKTTNLKQLRCHYILLGMNGLAYSPWGNDIAKEIKELEKKQKEKK